MSITKNVQKARDSTVAHGFLRLQSVTMMAMILALLTVSSAFAFEPMTWVDFKARPIPEFARRLEGQDLVDYINIVQPFFQANYTEISEVEERSRLMSSKFIVAPNERAEEIVLAEEIPESFDAREKWPECKSIKMVRDQSACGSCWAVSAASAMSDRVCVQSEGKSQTILSDTDILSCCGYSCGYGCDGVILLRLGVTLLGVVSGVEAHMERRKERICCEIDVAAIHKEIMTNGPVQAAFITYQDFSYYRKGIYIHTAGKQTGGHAIKLIGWGVEKGVPYWTVANSWNTDWGENGHFRILRGSNECGIESGVVAGMLKL